MYATYLILGLACGFACAFIAKQKGKNQVAWFFGGFIFSIAAVSVILLVKKKIAKK